MKRKGLFLWCALMSVALISAHSGLAQIGQAEHPTVLLWPERGTGSGGHEDADRPSLTLYFFRRAKPPAAPSWCAQEAAMPRWPWITKGRQIAEWLNSLGIAAYILKYRLAPRYHHPAMIEDAQRALRYVRVARAAMGNRPGPHRHLGFFRRRAPGLDRRNTLRRRKPFRRRSHRPSEFTAGFCHPVLIR